jgi:glutamate synthase domain-containing protein 2
MRYEFITFSLIVVLAIAGIAYSDASLFLKSPLISLFSVFLLVLVGLGYYDMFQKKRAIVRNFPILGRTRYLMEDLRPKIYQYFIESDTNGTPISRIHRSVVYQRAKKERDTAPFGTQLDVYSEGYEWMNHSIAAKDAEHLDHNPKVKIGSPQCTQPYDASILNISAMSFGSLSSAAMRALNAGAKIGGFAHNTGEGGISPYHLEMGGDLIWQIGTGYFGCRDFEGNFSPTLFKANSTISTIKMIEIKLSQGAKPGHGGILPAKKNTKEVAQIRNVKEGTDVISPPYHTAFSTPKELLQFAQQLRELCGGKPIGIKLCVGNKSEFVGICKAMLETGIYLDYVAVDGGEGGTGAAPVEFSNSVGMPMREGLAFVYDTLVGFDLKQHIKVLASGKILTSFDMFRTFALGADACYSARGMMLALGCIQALECNSNTCPTGVATQNPELVAGLVVSDKKVRVANFHSETIKNFVELLAAAGLEHSYEINRTMINRRVSIMDSKAYDEFYPYLEKGALLNPPYKNGFDRLMKISSADKF